MLGYPKYVADDITLEKKGGQWIGKVTHQGRDIMSVAFTPGAGASPTALSSEMPLTMFQLVPPNEGPQLNRVSFGAGAGRTTMRTIGTATITADAGEKWAGLLPAANAEISGWLEETTGDWGFQCEVLTPGPGSAGLCAALPE